MKKTKIPGLYTHSNGIYYFRRPIPRRLRAAFVGAEWKESLRTRDFPEAKTRFAAENARFEARLEVARTQLGSSVEPMTHERAAAIATTFLLGDNVSPTSKKDAKMRAMFTLAHVTGRVAEEHRAFLEERERLDPTDPCSYPFPDPVAVIRNDLEKQDLHRAAGILPELRAFAGLPEGASSKREERLLAEALLAKLIDPDVHKDRAVFIAEELQHLLPGVQYKDGKLTEAFAYWRKMRSARPQTIGEFEVAVSRFTAMFGDLPAKQITDDHAEAFKNAHLALPSPLTKLERERPFGELVIHFSRNGRGDRPGLAPASVKKFTGALSAIIKVSMKAFKLTHNPFAMLEVPNQKNGKVRPDTPRRPFTTEMLWQIFASPMFTGCAGRQDYKRRLQGEHVYQDDLYWIFILAAATGARLEELGQMLVSDVRTEDGINYLWLDNLGDDQEIKTDGSRRRVPLHPKVIALGFLEWARKNRAADAMVFAGLELNSNDKWTQNLSRRANVYLDRIGVDDPAYVFYSFRHKFKDECRDSGIPKEIHDQFTGHAKPDVGSKYGDGAALRKLNREMKKLKLPYFPPPREQRRAA